LRSFYNRSDLGAIAVQLSRGDLTGQDKTEADASWDAGFRTWDIAARAPADRLEGDSDTRLLVITSNNLNLQDFRDLLMRMSTTYPGAEYLESISNDLGGSSAAVEPWNAGG
jgi:hypothetical protein